MKLPIQYALTWPERQPSPARKLDLTQALQLDFEPPDEERFPALRLGTEVAAAGGTAGAVLNAANEAAVARFLAGELPFMQIVPACRAVLEHHTFNSDPALGRAAQARRLGTAGGSCGGYALILAAVGAERILPDDPDGVGAGRFCSVGGGLGFVIFVHELGHFLVAKACGVKCEKFYVGFDVPMLKILGSVKIPGKLFTFSGAKRSTASAFCRWAAT